MHDQSLMGMRYRRANGQKQLQARADAEFLLVAVARDFAAFDVLQHQIRFAIGTDAAIKQARNIRMIQRRQNLPLAAKSLQQFADIPARPHQFDRRLLVIFTIVSLGQIDRTHAATTDLAQQSPRPEPQADQGITLLRAFVVIQCLQQLRRGRAQRCAVAVRARVGSQHCDDFGLQIRAISAVLIEKCSAFADRQIDGLLEQCAYALPIVCVHASALIVWCRRGADDYGLAHASGIVASTPWSSRQTPVLSVRKLSVSL